MARREIRAGVRRLFGLPLRTRAQIRADADEELESFLAARIESLVARGADPAAARAEALGRLGGRSLDEVREHLYHSGTRREARMRVREAWDRFRQDVRFAARQLARAPGFTVVAALTLALGIGASTAIFSVVHPILLEPLPYPHAARIVAVWDFATDGAPLDVTFGTFRELARRSRSFDALAVVKPWQPVLTRVASTGPTEPERLDGQRVSADAFRVLGVPPAIGAGFDASADRPGGPNEVLLSDALWRRRFGADRTIVGRQITLNDAPYTVVGVMPSTFEHVLAPSAELWSLLQYDAALPAQGREWGHHLRMVGRLRAGVDVEDAARELGRIAATPLPDVPRMPWAALQQGLVVRSLRDDIARDVRPVLLAVLGAVLLLLVIACVNVTNLLLARGAARRGEFAMRVAIGAGGGRIVRQLLTESLLLALAGGALGMAVAAIGVRVLVAVSPPGLPRLDAIEVNAAVLAFGLALTTVVGVLFGLAPALYASRSDLRTVLDRSARRTAGGAQTTRRALVVAEVALALVLLVGAGLLLRSVRELLAVPPGFDASHVVTMQVQTSGRRFDDDGVTHRFFEQALDAVRRVPGVTAAGFVSQLPLSGDLDKYGVQFASIPSLEAGEDGSALRYAVSPGYLEAMRIPLRQGRPLDARDGAGAPAVALINASYARRTFRDKNPLGERLRLGGEDGPWATVVGVVGDVRHASLAIGDEPAVYVPPAQWRFADRARWLVVRARGDAAALVPALRNAVWSVDKDQPVVRIATMAQRVSASAAERRFALTLFEAFGVAALLLAAIGIYGVLSGSVAERVREIGVRAALGASRGDILVLVLRQGTLLTALGAVVGLGAAAIATRALVTLLFGVTPLDPVTYASVAALLLTVSGVACAVPAWRAARVDPSTTLRTD
jgi:putative ABC transport system permease protein